MIRKIKETRTTEYFLISREQLEFIFNIFLKLGTWKILEIMDMKRDSKEDRFIDALWADMEEALKES